MSSIEGLLFSTNARRREPCDNTVRLDIDSERCACVIATISRGTVAQSKQHSGAKRGKTQPLGMQR